jgi:gas vesicle protein
MGLLLTDAKLWSIINRQLRRHSDDWGDVARQKYDDWSDVAKERYEDAADRLHDASRALRGESDWITPTVTFVGGVGIGLAAGMLLTPVSGEEAREKLREKFQDVKNKATDIASEKGYYRSLAQSEIRWEPRCCKRRGFQTTEAT